MIRLLTSALAVLLVMAPAASAAAPAARQDAATARQATTVYRDVGTAQAAGYGVFADGPGIARIDKPGVGGMASPMQTGSTTPAKRSITGIPM